MEWNGKTTLNSIFEFEIAPLIHLYAGLSEFDQVIWLVAVT